MHQNRLRTERAGHGIDPGAQRRIHQMGIALGGLRLAVTQQLADHFQRGAAADQERGEGVAQVVDPDILDPDLLLYPLPEVADFLHRLAGHIARKQQLAAARDQNLALSDDGGGFIRDRQPVNAALLGHAGGLRPAQVFKVEMLEPGLPHLAHAGAGQHAEALRVYVVKAPFAETSAEDIIALSRKELAGYKVPRQIVFVTELPKSNVGKILRRELRKLAEG